MEGRNKNFLRGAKLLEMPPVRLEELLNRPHINAGRALTAEGAGKPEGKEAEPSLKK